VLHEAAGRLADPQAVTAAPAGQSSASA